MFKDDDDDQKHCTAYESTSDNSFGCNGTGFNDGSIMIGLPMQ